MEAASRRYMEIFHVIKYRYYHFFSVIIIIIVVGVVVFVFGQGVNDTYIVLSMVHTC